MVSMARVVAMYTVSVHEGVAATGYETDDGNVCLHVGRAEARLA